MPKTVELAFRPVPLGDEVQFTIFPADGGSPIFKDSISYAGLLMEKTKPPLDRLDIPAHKFTCKQTDISKLEIQVTVEPTKGDGRFRVQIESSGAGYHLSDETAVYTYEMFGAEPDESTQFGSTITLRPDRDIDGTWP